jgi:DNA-binding PadR family transcriptional regulator
MDPSLAGRFAEPFVLSLLSRGPQHGYALLKALESIFGEGAVPKARVYQILRRLREQGHVEAQGGASDRKEHALTDKGHELLAEMRDQRPEFFNELLMLFPGMEAALQGRGEKSNGDSLPRDGARTQLACPGCQDLKLSMERTLPGVELLIRVNRESAEARPHNEGCVVGLALRRLAASLLP